MEKLYVGNIPFEATGEDLRALLAQCGPLVNVEFPRDPSGKMPHRGFAHITFATEAAAADCMAMLNGFMFHGRPLRVQPCNPSSGTRATRGGPAPVPPRGGGFGLREPHGGQAFGAGGPQAPFAPPIQPFQQSHPPPLQTVASVRSVVEAMSAAEQYDILATLRSMCDTPGGRDSAIDLLSTCPSFAHAVLMMEERLGMLQVLPSSLAGPGSMPAGGHQVQPPQQQKGGAGGGDDVDIEQLREIIAYSDADVLRMPPSDYKSVVVQVRTALNWPESRIAELSPAERQELLILRTELQAALRRMN